jgi:hypothetical protein
VGHIDYQHGPPRPEYSPTWVATLSIERWMYTFISEYIFDTDVCDLITNGDRGDNPVYSYDPADFPSTPTGEKQ